MMVLKFPGQVRLAQSVKAFANQAWWLEFNPWSPYELTVNLSSNMYNSPNYIIHDTDTQIHTHSQHPHPHIHKHSHTYTDTHIYTLTTPKLLQGIHKFPEDSLLWTLQTGLDSIPLQAQNDPKSKPSQGKGFSFRWCWIMPSAVTCVFLRIGESIQECSEKVLLVRLFGPLLTVLMNCVKQHGRWKSLIKWLGEWHGVFLLLLKQYSTGRVEFGGSWGTQCGDSMAYKQPDAYHYSQVLSCPAFHVI